MKKVFSLLLVLCLAFALAVPSFAAGATPGSSDSIQQIGTPDQVKELNKALVADKSFINEEITNRTKAIICVPNYKKTVSADPSIGTATLKKQEAYFAGGSDESIVINSLQVSNNTLVLDASHLKNGAEMPVDQQLESGPVVIRLFLDKDALDPAHNDYTWTNGEQSGVAVVGYLTDYCYVEIVAPHFSTYTIAPSAKTPDVPNTSDTSSGSSEEGSSAPAAEKPAYDWMSVRNQLAVMNSGVLTVDVNNEIAVPHYVWQAFYGKNVTLVMKRGLDTFTFNGLTLKNSGFNPDTGHNLTDLMNYSRGTTAGGSVLAATDSDMSTAAAVILALAACAVGASAVVLKKRGLNK